MTVVRQAPWPAGFAIHHRGVTPDPELVEAFRGVPTTIVSDCLGSCVGALGLQSFHGDRTLALCGAALTVRVRPGDNLMIHKALTVARPGDVIVVDGSGDVSHALVGGLMLLAAQARGVAGFVIDGAIRDVLEWADGGMPVFARAHSHRRPSKEGPGEINVPVNCAGVVVAPGDLVIGDADGVIAVPPDRLALLLQDVRETLEQEEQQRQHHRACRTDPVLFARDDERVDSILRAKGCPV